MNTAVVGRLKKWFGIGAAAWLLAPAAVNAGAPADGRYTFHFNGRDLQLWDVGGNYSLSNLPFVGMANFAMGQDSSGKLLGTRTFNMNSGGTGVNMTLTVTGGTITKGAATVVQFKVVFKGTVTAGGRKYSYSGTVTEDFEVDPVARVLRGRVSGKVCAAGHCANYAANVGDVVLPFAAIGLNNMDGSFDLVLTLDNVNGKKIIGTGEVRLSDLNPGESGLPFNVTGTYDAKKDRTTLTLKGDPVRAKGSSLTLILDGNLALGSVKGKVLGQTLNLVR